MVLLARECGTLSTMPIIHFFVEMSSVAPCLSVDWVVVLMAKGIFVIPSILLCNVSCMLQTLHRCEEASVQITYFMKFTSFSHLFITDKENTVVCSNKHSYNNLCLKTLI
jgi:hypothetical protein